MLKVMPIAAPIFAPKMQLVTPKDCETIGLNRSEGNVHYHRIKSSGNKSFINSQIENMAF